MENWTLIIIIWKPSKWFILLKKGILKTVCSPVKKKEMAALS